MRWSSRGRRAFAQRRLTRSAESSPESVVRSMQEMARSSQAACQSFLTLRRVPMVAARRSTAEVLTRTSSTQLTSSGIRWFGISSRPWSATGTSGPSCFEITRGIDIPSVWVFSGFFIDDASVFTAISPLPTKTLRPARIPAGRNLSEDQVYTREDVAPRIASTENRYRSTRGFGKSVHHRPGFIDVLQCHQIRSDRQVGKSVACFAVWSAGRRAITCGEPRSASATADEGSRVPGELQVFEIVVVAGEVEMHSVLSEHGVQVLDQRAIVSERAIGIHGMMCHYDKKWCGQRLLELLREPL